MHISCNKCCVISSHSACSMVDLVSQNARFLVVFRTSVLKTQDDRRCDKWAFSMRAFVFHCEWAIKGMQTGFQLSVRHAVVPRAGQF